jgi:hypothetical protein
MVRRFFQVTFLSGTSALLALAAASCSADGGAEGGRGGAAGSQGGVGGGQGGTGGGQGGVGGGQGGAGGGELCPTDGQPCCGGLGTCVPSSCLLQEQASQLAQDACPAGADQLCAPSSLLSGVLPATCRSVDDAEGRCASVCIPQVGQLSERLPQEPCASSERCAPCYNPVDGVLTGICNLGTDSPQEPAYTFQECGDGRGKCVDEALVPENRRANVPQNTCPAGKLCAPKEAILDPAYQFPACTTTIAIYPDLPGVCVPDYVVRDHASYSLLNQGNCANAADKCAPCNDPTNGTPTGACN